MIRYAAMFLILFALLVLQSGLAANLGLGPAGNLILIFAVISAILGTFEESFFIVLVGGLMIDLVSGFRAGTSLISLFAVFGFTHLFMRFITREPTRLVLIICTGMNTLIFALAFVAVNKLLYAVHLDSPLDYSFILGKKILLDLAVNFVLTYPLLYLYNFLQSMISKMEKHRI